MPSGITKKRQEHIWEEGHARGPGKYAFVGFKGGIGESRDEEGALLVDSSGAKQRSPRGLPSHLRLPGWFRFSVNDPADAQECNSQTHKSQPCSALKGQ